MRPTRVCFWSLLLLGLTVVVLSLSLVTPKAWANSSKSEAALQGELSKARAELAQQKESIDKLSKSNRDGQAVASQQSRKVREAQNDNAGKAQAAVEDAQDANQQAVLAAIAARTQADALMKVSQHNDFATYATLITTASGFLTLLAGFFWKAFTDARDHRWIVEAANAQAVATAAHRALELEKLDGVKVDAQKAYDTANNVNAKIASLGLKVPE